MFCRMSKSVLSLLLQKRQDKIQLRSSDIESRKGQTVVKFWRDLGDVSKVHVGEKIDRDVGRPVADDLIFGEDLELFLQFCFTI